MERKRELTTIEKDQIVKLLSNQKTTIELARTLSRDRRTIKNFVQKASKVRSRSDKGHFRIIKKNEMTVLKMAIVRNPLTMPRKCFNESNIQVESRTSRCRTIQVLAEMKSAIKKPPLTMNYKERGVEFAVKYMKQDFNKVRFSDECRATLDGPDGFSRGWVLNKLNIPVRLRRQEGREGVMFWAAILGSKLIGPFKLPDSKKMAAFTYTEFLEQNLIPEIHLLEPGLQNKFVFMHDNAPSHASLMARIFLRIHNFTGKRLMNWPANSPDLNPIETLWAIVKANLYEGGKQYNNENDLWDSIKTICFKIEPHTVQNLTKSMDERMVTILKDKGSYVYH